MNSSADTASVDSSDTTSPEDISSDRPTLILSRGDSSNDTYECDALGIHYELSTPQSAFRPQRVSTISRWDASLNRCARGGMGALHVQEGYDQDGGAGCEGVRALERGLSAYVGLTVRCDIVSELDVPCPFARVC